MLPHARGLGGPFACLNSARYGISWGALGAAEACVAAALDYTLQRQQFKVRLSYNLLVCPIHPPYHPSPYTTLHSCLFVCPSIIVLF